MCSGTGVGDKSANLWARSSNLTNVHVILFLFFYLEPLTVTCRTYLERLVWDILGSTIGIYIGCPKDVSF
ncbi:Uncharacterized protein APZ42_007292 [Daphnia magna]|uniref:Uncharacterized protein n=1 Tax=Daphnia magna TaxID=35525 RepID=A0A164FDL5_9CRUS|nr:Uncharacterized protein APZ42_007292 [Daphnia magna]